MGEPPDDAFVPALRYLVVACKGKRWFDLDAVREPARTGDRVMRQTTPTFDPERSRGQSSHGERLQANNPAGAPPLDYWLVTDDEPDYPKDVNMGTARYIVGDALKVLATLPDDSVDLVFSSPPFLALRSYLPADHPDKALEIGSESTPGEFLDVLLDVVEGCARVLAPHGSLVFELGDTYAGSGGAGGDYGDAGWRAGQLTFKQQQKVAPKDSSGPRLRDRRNVAHTGNKNRDKRPGWPLDRSLCLIPQLFAFSLAYGFNPLTGRTTDRWRVRNYVAWCRPNPPVGALGDKFRPATSYLTVACKNRRWFDLDAVRTEHTVSDAGPYRGRKASAVPGGDSRDVDCGVRGELNPAGAPPLDFWVIPTEPEDVLPGFDQPPPKPYTNPNTHARTAKGVASRPNDTTKVSPDSNRGSLPIQHTSAPAPPLDYWVIPTEAFPGSHYATFPRALVVKPVKAMCPARVCRVCGKPSERITEPTPEYAERLSKVTEQAAPLSNGSNRSNPARLSKGKGHFKDAGRDVGGPGNRRGEEYETAQRTTLGWTDCGHDDWRPGVVLDPFAGSGTALAVATGHGRDAIGIDLDARNAELARERVGPMFFELELPVSDG